MPNQSFVIENKGKPKLLYILYGSTLLIVIVILILLNKPTVNPPDTNEPAQTATNTIIPTSKPQVLDNSERVNQNNPGQFRGDVTKILPNVLEVEDSLANVFQCLETADTFVTVDTFQAAANPFSDPPQLLSSNQIITFQQIKIGDSVTIDFKADQEKGNNCINIKIIRIKN